MHNPRVGPNDLPPVPGLPFTDAERHVKNQSGEQQGDAIVNLVREMQTQQVIHVTTPAPPPAIVNVPGHLHDHDENLDVLIAFVLAVVTFFVSWWAIGQSAELSTWNDVRWAGVIGLGVGFVYLAISNGVRRVL
jgi:hypothetical protein